MAMPAVEHCAKAITTETSFRAISIPEATLKMTPSLRLQLVAPGFQGIAVETGASREEVAMRIAIVGCGLIGQKRLRSLRPGDEVVALVDSTRARAEGLAAQARGAAVLTDWRAAVERTDVDAVFVATSNDALAPITLAAVEAGKHVLVEKPAARGPRGADANHRGGQSAGAFAFRSASITGTIRRCSRRARCSTRASSVR